MAAGLPGMDALTESVAQQLDEDQLEQFTKLRDGAGGGNVEVVLSRLRLLANLLSAEGEEFLGLDLQAAERLDGAICASIAENILSAEADCGEIEPQLQFVRWINHWRSRWPVEVFTTNYDLLLERAFELERVPFFDGFVGSVNPFFRGESVDALPSGQTERDYAPSAWTRLWKLHGSLGWQMSKTDRGLVATRGHRTEALDHLLIYPSHEKYDEARRLPFLTYLDRFRQVLKQPDLLLVVAGYSFNDDHITETMVDGLSANPRASALVLNWDSLPEVLAQHACRNPNITALGLTEAVIGGRRGEWNDEVDADELGCAWIVSDDRTGWNLGDFGALAEFLSSLFASPNRHQDID